MEDFQLHLGLAPGLEFSVHGKQQKPSVIYIYIFVSYICRQESNHPCTPSRIQPLASLWLIPLTFWLSRCCWTYFYPMLPHPQAYS